MPSTTSLVCERLSAEGSGGAGASSHEPVIPLGGSAAFSQQTGTAHTLRTTLQRLAAIDAELSDLCEQRLAVEAVGTVVSDRANRSGLGPEIHRTVDEAIEGLLSEQAPREVSLRAEKEHISSDPLVIEGLEIPGKIADVKIRLLRFAEGLVLEKGTLWDIGLGQQQCNCELGERLVQSIGQAVDDTAWRRLGFYDSLNSVSALMKNGLRRLAQKVTSEARGIGVSCDFDDAKTTGQRETLNLNSRILDPNWRLEEVFRPWRENPEQVLDNLIARGALKRAKRIFDSEEVLVFLHELSQLGYSEGCSLVRLEGLGVTAHHAVVELEDLNQTHRRLWGEPIPNLDVFAQEFYSRARSAEDGFLIVPGKDAFVESSSEPCERIRWMIGYIWRSEEGRKFHAPPARGQL